MKHLLFAAAALAAAATFAAAAPAAAATVFNFTTGGPDGKIGAQSQVADATHIQTETADDFHLASTTRIKSASFTGLLAAGAQQTDIEDVEIEIYHVFPGDSAVRVPGVTTRANSPADFEIADATRGGAAGGLTGGVGNPQAFSVLNTVTTGIRGGDSTSEFTGGDGPATGTEVTFFIDFTNPIELGAGDFFFRPEVRLANGNFLWLSATRPAQVPGAPLDRQAWIRNDNLAPDWLRIGTDITRQTPVNMSFSLNGVAGVPEPATWALMIGGFGLAGASLRRQRRRAAAA